MSTTIYDTRQDMVQSLDIHGYIAEIGVFRGDFAQDLLTLCPNITKLDLVDIWTPEIMSSGDQDGNNVQQYSGIDNYKHVCDRFQNQSNIVHIIRMWSYDYFATLSNAILDAVYIDGDHSFAGCYKDLEAAYRVVKPGGLIMGHDYMITERCKHDWKFGVHDAVKLFIKKYNLDLLATTKDGCASFAIRLPLTSTSTPSTFEIYHKHNGRLL